MLLGEHEVRDRRTLETRFGVCTRLRALDEQQFFCYLGGITRAGMGLEFSSFGRRRESTSGLRQSGRSRELALGRTTAASRSVPRGGRWG